MSKFWFLHDMQDDIKKSILNRLEADPDFCPKQYLIDEITRAFPHRVESPLNTLYRTENIKNFLRSMIKSPNYRGGKIVLVGHQTIFKFMTGTEWETMPSNQSIKMGNIRLR